jgi:hypothetical protein
MGIEMTIGNDVYTREYLEQYPEIDIKPIEFIEG